MFVGQLERRLGRRDVDDDDLIELVLRLKGPQVGLDAVDGLARRCETCCASGRSARARIVSLVCRTVPGRTLPLQASNSGEHASICRAVKTPDRSFSPSTASRKSDCRMSWPPTNEVGRPIEVETVADGQGRDQAGRRRQLAGKRGEAESDGRADAAEGTDEPQADATGCHKSGLGRAIRGG